MATWKRIKIERENGEWVDAQAPEIVSASRSTDIPAFYADWFFDRLKKGYSAWTNPFNGVKSYVSYKNTRFIVFWSKNPRPLLGYLEELKKMSINCYIQYTLNDYVKEGLEKGVPPLDERIETFKILVDKLGKGHVVWRFDPMVMTDKISLNDLLKKVEHIGDQLLGFTEKLVFSFADIAEYKKVKINLDNNGINYKLWTESDMLQFAEQLSILNKKWGYTLATCGEKIDLSQLGIEHNRCIDDELMIKLAYKDEVLMRFLGVEIREKENSLFGDETIPDNAIYLDATHYAIKTKDNRDKGQRLFCGCMASKDIGEYNTCPHMCEYCYANTNKATAVKNWKEHQGNRWSETITGK